MDYTRRFDKRAIDYSKYRPSYPPEILNILKSHINFDPKTIVADIGSGTGLLSNLFLQNGNPVYAVEPNEQMRTLAEQALSSYANFVSVNGRAEKTTLENASIDLVTVGQALHWFDPQLSTNEFARILRPEGNVLVLYNDRNKEDPTMRDYETIVSRHEKDRAVVPDVNDEYFSRFFQNGSHKSFKLRNEQLLDREGVLGRLTSASYMPNVDDERFNSLKSDVSALFDRWQKDGKVRLLYDTMLSLGPVRRGHE